MSVESYTINCQDSCPGAAWHRQTPEALCELPLLIYWVPAADACFLKGKNWSASFPWHRLCPPRHRTRPLLSAWVSLIDTDTSLFPQHSVSRLGVLGNSAQRQSVPMLQTESQPPLARGRNLSRKMLMFYTPRETFRRWISDLSQECWITYMHARLAPIRYFTNHSGMACYSRDFPSSMCLPLGSPAGRQGFMVCLLTGPARSVQTDSRWCNTFQGSLCQWLAGLSQAVQRVHTVGFGPTQTVTITHLCHCGQGSM